MANRALQFFTYEHLNEPLRSVSKEIAHVANVLDRILPENPEKSAGMRKLLEAKDCFVRALLWKDE